MHVAFKKYKDRRQLVQRSTIWFCNSHRSPSTVVDEKPVQPSFSAHQIIWAHRVIFTSNYKASERKSKDGIERVIWIGCGQAKKTSSLRNWTNWWTKTPLFCMPQETLEAPPSDEEVALAKAQTINSFVFNFASTGSQLQRRLVYDLEGLPEVCNKAHSARYWSSRFRNTLQSLVLRWTELNITVDYSISSGRGFVQYSFSIWFYRICVSKGMWTSVIMLHLMA